VVPPGLGVLWILQAAPFHATANAKAAEEVPEYPTAVQSLVELHVKGPFTRSPP
jgi:hypothetical protein